MKLKFRIQEKDYRSSAVNLIIILKMISGKYMKKPMSCRLVLQSSDKKKKRSVTSAMIWKEELFVLAIQ